MPDTRKFVTTERHFRLPGRETTHRVNSPEVERSLWAPRHRLRAHAIGRRWRRGTVDRRPTDGRRRHCHCACASGTCRRSANISGWLLALCR